LSLLVAALVLGCAGSPAVKADDSGSAKAESVAVAAKMADFAGEWDVHVGSPTGAAFGKLTLEKDGENWKGVFTDMNGVKSQVSGKRDGDDLALTVSPHEGSSDAPMTVKLKQQDDLLVTNFTDENGQSTDVYLSRAKVMKATDPVGEWSLTMQANGREFTPTLVIRKDGDHYAGEYKRGQQNATSSPLKSVSLEGDTLKFSVEFTPRNGGDTRTIEFTGKIDGDTMTGHRSTQNGEASFTGKRKAVPALAGEWDFVVKTTNQDYPGSATIRKSGDGYEGDYFYTPGTSVPMKDLGLKDGTVQFSIMVPMSPDPLKVDFKGALKDDSIAGDATSTYGPSPFTAKRKATASVDLSGAWAMEIKAPNQTFTPTLTLKQSGSEITGTMEGPRGPAELKEGSFKDGELHFIISFNGQDNQEFKLTVAGKLDGEKLVGQVTSPMGSIPWSAERKK
jgi:hypothetical protein